MISQSIIHEKQKRDEHYETANQLVLLAQAPLSLVIKYVENKTKFDKITNKSSNFKTIPDPNQLFFAMCDPSSFEKIAALLESHQGTNQMKLNPANSKLATHVEFELFKLAIL